MINSKNVACRLFFVSVLDQSELQVAHTDSNWRPVVWVEKVMSVFVPPGWVFSSQLPDSRGWFRPLTAVCSITWLRWMTSRKWSGGLVAPLAFYWSQQEAEKAKILRWSRSESFRKSVISLLQTVSRQRQYTVQFIARSRYAQIVRFLCTWFALKNCSRHLNSNTYMGKLFVSSSRFKGGFLMYN